MLPNTGIVAPPGTSKGTPVLPPDVPVPVADTEPSPDVMLALTRVPTLARDIVKAPLLTLEEAVAGAIAVTVVADVNGLLKLSDRLYVSLLLVDVKDAVVAKLPIVPLVIVPLVKVTIGDPDEFSTVTEVGVIVDADTPLVELISS
jgi:hypothetical protein